MDLGCLDLGCISVLEKQGKDEVSVSVDSEKKDGDSPTSSRKNKVPKGTGISAHTAVNKSYSQLKKPHRKNSSPLNWFPRKKVDSYLKRKIRLLQEVGGMTSTLDETLGDSNPHYSRVLREKIAAREAACQAMEARKAALVETSWCRILRAARIQSKEAEAMLEKAEKAVVEAFEAAAALGVIMYDRPDCPRKPCEVESSSVNMGGSTTHTVTASFETPFEVDKEVAAAVKTAFIRLANSSSALEKDEHRDLLRRISQNPDMDEALGEVSEGSSDSESDTRSEVESKSLGDGFNSQIIEPSRERLRKTKSRQLHSISSTKLIDIMLERLKCLQENELASLATIVATCGLNAVLLEVENNKHHDSVSRIDCTIKDSLARRVTVDYSRNGQTRNEQVVPELPGLDKVLVKHMSRLEREVQEAKNRRKNDSKGVSVEENTEGSENTSDTSRNITSEAVPDLGSILVKHASKLEKEIEVAKKISGKEFELKPKQLRTAQADVPGLPSLDKFLVKRVSRLEREVQEARNRRKDDLTVRNGLSRPDISADSCENVAGFPNMVNSSSEDRKQAGKENIDSNKQAEEVLDGTIKEKVADVEQQEKQDPATFAAEHSSIDFSEKKCADSLDQILPKHQPELEKEKSLQHPVEETKYSKTRREARERELQEAWGSECDSLEKVLVKPIPQSNMAKMELGPKEEVKKARNIDIKTANSSDSLDKILVKRQSRLEKEKLAWQQQVNETKHSQTRRELRERELQKAWGGISLGHSVRTRPSKLEQDKAAWIKEEGNKKIETTDSQNKNCTESLDHILVKHQSRLEKEKLALQQSVDEIKPSMNRREARERELQQAWGGLSLGNSVRPYVSRLERDKAAWTKAEEEERSQAREELET